VRFTQEAIRRVRKPDFWPEIELTLQFDLTRDGLDGEISSILRSPLSVSLSLDYPVRSRHVRRNRETDLLLGARSAHSLRVALDTQSDFRLSALTRFQTVDKVE
jgi:hypothetical protein